MAEAGENPKPKESTSVSPAQSDPATAAATPTITPPPPGLISPQIPPQMMALQLGFGMQGQQQNPEVMNHITSFLAHDSDNRLRALESSGKRNHTFRMFALSIGAGMVILIVVVPLMVQLFKGDMSFVDKILTSYLPVLGAIILALFAGPKVSDFFRS